MLKVSTKLWWENVKFFVKSKSYAFLLFFVIVATIVVFSQNLVNAAPRKKAVRAASNKRAATNSSSSASKPVSKRAATNGSKRAATNKRAAGSVSARVGSRSRGNAKNGDAKTVDTTTSSTPKENVCPVGVMLKKVLGGDGVAIYYSAKNTVCVLPKDNVALVNQWVKADSSSYTMTLQKHPSWMSDREAVFLTCTSGYVEKTVNKVKTCVMASGICPLGEIVEKSEDGFIHPFTKKTCVIPENAVTSNVRGDENTLSYSVADDNAYKFECPSNYYSVLTDTSPALRVGCVACPNGYNAPVGATSASECGKETKVAKESEVKESTVATVEPKASEVDDAEAKRLAKLRIKKVEGTADDYTCVDGWTNNWTYDEIASKTHSECKSYFRVGFIMDKDGIIKNVVDRNTYGKNKRGCPIKLDKYLDNYFGDHHSESVERTFYYDKSFSPGNIRFGWCPNSVNVRYLTNILNGLRNITVVLCPSVSDNNYTIFKPKFGVLKKQMTSSDIDNTGVNGWTEEEYNAWGGYRPILGGYYDLSKLEGREASSKSCSGLSSEYYHPSGIVASDIEKIKKDYSEKNLFTYWD